MWERTRTANHFSNGLWSSLEDLGADSVERALDISGFAKWLNHGFSSENDEGVIKFLQIVWVIILEDGEADHSMWGYVFIQESDAFISSFLDADSWVEALSSVTFTENAFWVLAWDEENRCDIDLADATSSLCYCDNISIHGILLNLWILIVPFDMISE